MEIDRWVGAGLLLALGLFVSLLNGAIFVAGLVGKRTPSWVPLLGGVSAALGCLLAPCATLNGLWWLPLLVDWGSAPGLLHAAVWHLTRRRRDGNQ